MLLNPIALLSVQVMVFQCEVTLNLCKKGTVLTLSHTSLWLQMLRCTGHSYLKNTTFTVQNLFYLKFIFLVAITSKKHL